MKRWLVVGVLALAACIDFRGPIDTRCANGTLAGCPDAGATGGGDDAGGGGGGGALGGGAGGGGGAPSFDGGLSCGATRCVFDGGSSICFNGWCWESPLPQGNDLRAVWGSADEDVWAAGEVGMLLHWDGSRWTSWQGELGLERNWNSIWGSSASSVWMVSGTLTSQHVAPWRFDGLTWREEAWLAGPSPTARLFSVSGDDAGSVVAVGADGLIATWSPQGWRGARHALGTSMGRHLTSVAFDAPGSCWVTLVGGTAGGVAHCDAGTFDYLSPSGEELISLAAEGPGSLWAAGYNINNGHGTLFSRSPAGAWTLVVDAGRGLQAVTVAEDPLAAGEDTIINGRTASQEPGSARWNRGIWSSPTRSSGWTVGEMGEMARSQFEGVWNDFGQSFRTNLWSLRMTPQFLRACTQNGAVVFPNPNGPGWAKDYVNVATTNIYDHWYTAAGDFSVVVDGNGIYESRTPGNLQYDAGPSFADSTSVWGSGRDDVWVANVSGQTMHRTATGWNAGFFAGARINDIDGTSATRAWMVGVGGGVLRRTGPETWLGVPLGSSIDLSGVWVPPPGGRAEAIAVGEGIYRHADGGWEELEPETAGVHYEAVWGFSEDDFYVVGRGGAVVHYQAGQLIKLELGTRKDLFTVIGRTDAGVKELWVAGQLGTVLHAVVP